MASEIQGYNFDGDPDGIKFFGNLSWDELQTVLYCVDNKGKAHLQSNISGVTMHFEITKSSDGIYMISKTQPASSSSWF